MITVLLFVGLDKARDLHSFPTRRSSDLPACRTGIDATQRPVSAQPVDATPPDIDLLLKGGVRDAETMEVVFGDRKSTRLNSSHMSISYAVFCLKKKKGPAEGPHPVPAGQ